MGTWCDVTWRLGRMRHGVSCTRCFNELILILILIRMEGMNVNNSGYSTVLCRQKHQASQSEFKSTWMQTWIQIKWTYMYLNWHGLTVWSIILFYHIGIPENPLSLLEVDASFCSSSPFFRSSAWVLSRSRKSSRCSFVCFLTATYYITSKSSLSIISHI